MSYTCRHCGNQREEGHRYLCAADFNTGTVDVAIRYCQPPPFKLRNGFTCGGCGTSYPAEYVDDVVVPDKVCSVLVYGTGGRMERRRCYPAVAYDERGRRLG